MRQSTSDLPSNVLDAVIERLEEAPVSLALLFGSNATGQATSGSDIDIAIEYDDTIEDTTDSRLSLIADLTRIMVVMTSMWCD